MSASISDTARDQAAAAFDLAVARAPALAEFPVDRSVSPSWITVPASWVYGLLASAYHRRFDKMQIFRAPVPVISVGNLAVGGTGKTPCVIALAKIICEMEPRLAGPNQIAVLSRGYGRASSDLVEVQPDADYLLCGDEPLLIKRALPNLAVVVNADRVRAAKYAALELGSKLLLLDDGFQHRRLARDLDLVLMDGLHPLGNGRVLPAGPLREPANGLRRATAVVGVGASAAGAAELARQMGKPCVAAQVRTILPAELSTDLSTPVWVVTSIARPSRFLSALRKSDVNVLGIDVFGDHHRFSAGEIARVCASGREAGARALLTTKKDAIRMPREWGSLPVWAADAAFEFADSRAIQTLLWPWTSRALG